MMIPMSSLVGMWVYIGVLLAGIFAIFWIFGHRVEMNLSTMLLGAIAAFVFDTVLLELFFDGLIVGSFSVGLYEQVSTIPAAFVAYFALTRGIFYMLGMYIATRMSMRSDTSGGGFAIGIGFVAGYAITNKTYGAWTVFQAWRTATTINDLGGVDGYVALAESEGVVGEELESLRLSAQQLAATDISYYLINIFEFVLLLAALFALAVIVHLSTTRRAPYFYLPVAVGLFVLSNLPTALYLAGFLPGRWLYDILLVVVAGGLIALAAVLSKRYMKNQMQW